MYIRSYEVSNTTLGSIFCHQNKFETGGRFWTRTYTSRRLSGRTEHFQPFEPAFSHQKSNLERILGIAACVHLVRDPNRKWQKMPKLFMFEPIFIKNMSSESVVGLPPNQEIDSDYACVCVACEAA